MSNWSSFSTSVVPQPPKVPPPRPPPGVPKSVTVIVPKVPDHPHSTPIITSNTKSLREKDSKDILITSPPKQIEIPSVFRNIEPTPTQIKIKKTNSTKIRPDEGYKSKQTLIKTDLQAFDVVIEDNTVKMKTQMFEKTIVSNYNNPEFSDMKKKKPTKVFPSPEVQEEIKTIPKFVVGTKETNNLTPLRSSPTPISPPVSPPKQMVKFVTKKETTSNRSLSDSNIRFNNEVIPTFTPEKMLDISAVEIEVKPKYRPAIPVRPAVIPRVRLRYSLKDFELGVTLGTGSFGRVKFAKFVDPINGSLEKETRIALKILQKECIRRLNQIEHIKHEKAILQALVRASVTLENENDDEPWMPKTPHHPFIVHLFGAFQTKSYLYMVLEFIRGGEFFCHLRFRGHFKNDEAIFYAASVASVFAFLHAQDVAYRDLKPENLLLDHLGYVKMVDFGFAKRVPDNKTFTLCGTPEYIAPEVLLNQGHGKGVDWWALGILTYEMLSGVAPFTDSDPMNIYQKIVKGTVQYPSYFDSDARSFLRRLLQVNLNKRFGCLAAGPSDVLTHRWLASVNFEMLLKRQLTPPIVPTVNGIDDTSCFEEYPVTKEDEEVLEDLPYEGGGDFENFDVVC